MGFDLSPRNKTAGGFHMGAFSWSWMLDAGVGLVIGYGPASNPASFSYVPDAKGRCPAYYDGYRVSADEARMMAAAARGLARVHRWRNKEWSDLTPEVKQQREEWNKRSELYKPPVREDFIELAERFAEWADKSGGFQIW